MKPIEKAERYTLSKLVVQNVKQYILEQQISPGGKLPAERELAKIMNVSRAILREALRSLESAGILDIRHGEGAFVSNQSLKPLLEQMAFSAQLRGVEQELADVRRMLECAAVDAITTGGREEALLDLKPAGQAVGQPHLTDEQRIDADARFHLAVFALLGNDTMTQMADILIRQTQPYSSTHLEPAAHAEEHLRYVQALLDRDDRLAKQILSEHL